MTSDPATARQPSPGDPGAPNDPVVVDHPQHATGDGLAVLADSHAVLEDGESYQQSDVGGKGSPGSAGSNSLPSGPTANVSMISAVSPRKSTSTMHVSHWYTGAVEPSGSVSSPVASRSRLHFGQ